MTDIEKMMKEFLYTDFADTLFTLKLKRQMEDSFENLDILAGNNPMPDHRWEDYADNIRMVRSCITILQWYENKNYDEELKRVNKHSLKFEEVF